jgi:hypothetical protein
LGSLDGLAGLTWPREKQERMIIRERWSPYSDHDSHHIEKSVPNRLEQPKRNIRIAATTEQPTRQTQNTSTDGARLALLC